MPQFDRRVHFDERSRDFPIRDLVVGKELRTYTWRCSTYLNQGREGACVGFSFSHELAARPIEVDVTNESALEYYKEAQVLDSWPGENYEGTSVLAGAKNGVERGYFDAYRWSFSLNDLMLAIGHAGPAVLGVNWHEDMMEPDAQGWIHPTGEVVGGHAILCKGISLRDSGYFTLHNSWGQGWGKNGVCRISIDEMADLLSDDGEACIPSGRHDPDPAYTG